MIRIAGMSGSPDVDISKRAVVVMCADNGVVAEGVTQTGQEVTAIVAENMSTGDTSVCAMSRAAGAEVVPVDIGTAVPVMGATMLVALSCTRTPCWYGIINSLLSGWWRSPRAPSGRVCKRRPRSG